MSKFGLLLTFIAAMAATLTWLSAGPAFAIGEEAIVSACVGGANSDSLTCYQVCSLAEKTFELQGMSRATQHSCEFAQRGCEAHNVRNGACSQSSCVHKLAAIERGHDGSFDEWAEDGYLVKRMIRFSGDVNGIYSQLYYRVTHDERLIYVINQIFGGNTCGFIWDQYKSYRGPRLTELGRFLVITIPRT